MTMADISLFQANTGMKVVSMLELLKMTNIRVIFLVFWLVEMSCGSVDRVEKDWKKNTKKWYLWHFNTSLVERNAINKFSYKAGLSTGFE